MKKKIKFGGFEETLCIILLAAATIVTLLQVIFRFTGIDLSWTEEVARYLFVWIIYMSCAVAVRDRKHIKIEALLLVLKRKGQFIVNMLSDFFFLLFALLVTVYGVNVVYQIGAVQKQVSAATKLPMWIPYASVVVGFACMAVRLIQDMYRLIKEYKSGEDIELEAVEAAPELIEEGE